MAVGYPSWMPRGGIPPFSGERHCPGHPSSSAWTLSSRTSGNGLAAPGAQTQLAGPDPSRPPIDETPEQSLRTLENHGCVRPQFPETDHPTARCVRPRRCPRQGGGWGGILPEGHPHPRSGGGGEHVPREGADTCDIKYKPVAN